MNIRPGSNLAFRVKLWLAAVPGFLVAVFAWCHGDWAPKRTQSVSTLESSPLPRPALDSSGFILQKSLLPPVKPDASLADIARIWDRPGLQIFQMLEKAVENPANSGMARLQILLAQ